MFPRLIGPVPSASTGAVPRYIPRANSRIMIDNTQFFKFNPYCSQLVKLTAVTSSVRCVLPCCEEDSLCELGRAVCITVCSKFTNLGTRVIVSRTESNPRNTAVLGELRDSTMAVFWPVATFSADAESRKITIQLWCRWNCCMYVGPREQAHTKSTFILRLTMRVYEPRATRISPELRYIPHTGQANT